jgi:hypothetical protein
MEEKSEKVFERVLTNSFENDRMSFRMDFENLEIQNWRKTNENF